MAAKTITLKRALTAAPADVYRAFTNATSLREWLCDTATLEPRKGGRLYLAWNDGTALTGAYTALAPGKKIAFAVRAGDQALPSQITVTLAGRKDKTVLTLVETGSDKAWAKRLAAVEAGWAGALENLQSVLETGQDLRIVRRPMLGIGQDEFSAAIAAKLGVPITEGVRISGTLEGMGAHAAGLRQDDVIVALNGKKTPTWPAFTAQLVGARAGDTLKVTFYRGAEKKSVAMTLSPRPIPQVPPDPQALADAVQKVYAEWDPQVAQCFEGVAEEHAARPPAPAEWSAREVLAHLILGERNTQFWIEDLVCGEERWTDGWGGNVTAHTRSLAAVRGSAAGMLEELRRSEAETVAFIAALPPEFVAARKGSYWRIGQSVLQGAQHTQEHLAQIRAAISAARQAG